MFKWIGAILMGTIKDMTARKAVELLATGEIISNVIDEAADRAENVADLLESIEEGLKERQNDL